MCATQPQILPAPFDAVAQRYDETFSSSRIGQTQRASAWHELEKTFHAGDRVLEIGCGTGIDACFLARRGVRVVACDSSARMIAVAAHRISESGLQNSVRPLLLRAEDISSLPPGEPFDGAFSNFGALNCVEDLPRLARDLASLLKPRARALLCWMGPFCLWEVIWYLAHGNGSKGLRRLWRKGVTARIAEDAYVRVHYPSVRKLARVFAPEFRLKCLTGIGVAVPPSYLEDWARRHSYLFRICQRADYALGRSPGIRTLADHVLLQFERNGDSSNGSRWR